MILGRQIRRIRRARATQNLNDCVKAEYLGGVRMLSKKHLRHGAHRHLAFDESGGAIAVIVHCHGGWIIKDPKAAALLFQAIGEFDVFPGSLFEITIKALGPPIFDNRSLYRYVCGIEESPIEIRIRHEVGIAELLAPVTLDMAHDEVHESLIVVGPDNLAQYRDII